MEVRYQMNAQISSADRMPEGAKEIKMQDATDAKEARCKMPTDAKEARCSKI